MIEILKKLFGANTVSDAGTTETVQVADEYGDLSELLEFVKADNRTQFQWKELKNKFTGKRFVIDVKVRDIAGFSNLIFVYFDNFVFSFSTEWGSELITLCKGQTVTIDGAFEQLIHDALHLCECRIVKNDSDGNSIDSIEVQDGQS